MYCFGHFKSTTYYRSSVCPTVKTFWSESDSPEYIIKGRPCVYLDLYYNFLDYDTVGRFRISIIWRVKYVLFAYVTPFPSRVQRTRYTSETNPRHTVNKIQTTGRHVYCPNSMRQKIHR